MWRTYHREPNTKLPPEDYGCWTKDLVAMQAAMAANLKFPGGPTMKEFAKDNVVTTDYEGRISLRCIKHRPMYDFPVWGLLWDPVDNELGPVCP